jgi:hypothetical protein
MTSSTINASNQTTHFQNKVRKEYVRGGRFGQYIGKDENSIIQVNNDLKKVSIPLVGKLTGAAIEGSAQLTGSETPLSNYAMTLQPTYKRKGVLVDNEENEKAEFDLFSEARPALMNWAMELKRDEIIQAFGAVEAAGVYYNYGGTKGATGSIEATAGAMDTWRTNNLDRVLYGALKSNNATGHTQSLATIDTTADKMTANMVTLLKRMAKQASPLIRPIMVKDDVPWFVLWLGSYSFRDLKQDSTMTQANREARARNLDNPIFADGDLVYDGVIIKEVPEIDIFIDGDGTGSPWDGVWGANAASGDGLDNGGDSSSRIGVGFLTGAQAVGFGVGRMASFKRRSEDDYEHLNGVGITMKHDIKKIFYNNKQHGMVTCFHSAARDS